MYLRCMKCSRQDEWVFAFDEMREQDPRAGICINCSDRFIAWCESHPNEPSQNFLHPKPWPIRKIPINLTPEERLLWAIFGR